ncbi:DUF2199 domain-containing protein [Roseivirga pacifica]|uniref:DUF2199 domain-containing protein n=1 Tax=Roseivirga pacifica TaxID=1267423 RepID=UPI003BAE6C29
MFWKRKKKTNNTCEICGQEHESLPSIGFNEPHYYSILDDDEKREITEINPDFCIIKHDDQTDFFIRTFLRIDLNDACGCFDYGVWVSVSQKTFDEYHSEFNSADKAKSYFGRIANEIGDYDESTLGIHVNVDTNLNGNRPELSPHESTHQLVQDWKAGISKREAENRINMLSNSN